MLRRETLVYLLIVTHFIPLVKDVSMSRIPQNDRFYRGGRFQGTLVAVEDCDGCMMVAVLRTNSYEPCIQFPVPGYVDKSSCPPDSPSPTKLRPLGLQRPLHGHIQVDIGSTGA